MTSTANNMQRLTRRVAIGLTPPFAAGLIKRMIPRLGVSRHPSRLDNSDRDVQSDQYIQWIRYILGGFLNSGNIKAFDYAVRYMPAGGAVVEIGSLFGLSTNILLYLTIKYHRDNPMFTCDPWLLELAEEPVLSGYFDTRSESYRDYAKSIFLMNTELFSGERKPHAIEAFSHQFLELWHSNSTAEDVFGRSVTLGGPISFAYIDGAHTYDAVKGDFLGVDQHLLPGGFILFDDSADQSPFEAA